MSSSLPSTLAEQLSAIGPELVLVDYFDTLVTRQIDAKTVKRVVARHVAERFAIDGGAPAVVTARRTAERDGIAAARSAGNDGEHCIDDMAARMWALLFNDPDDSELAGGPALDVFVQTLLEIELSVEVASQEVDEDLVDVVRSLGCPVVLVSDFHFTNDLFVEMVRRKGLGSLVAQPTCTASLAESIFVSGSIGLSKASVRLYAHVESALEPAGRWPGRSAVAMVGDNPISDVANAEAAGLRGVRVVRTATVDSPPSTHPVDRGRRLAVRVASDHAGPLVDRSRVRRALARSSANDDKAPFIEMAATLFAFTRLLAEDCLAEGSAPAFLAREGLILKELFDHFVAVSPLSSGREVGSSYLVVSRRSTVLAGLRPLDEEDFSALLARYPGLSMLELMQTLGLDETQVAETVGAGDLFDAPVDVEVLRSHGPFASVYEAERLAQRSLLDEYVTGVAGPGRDLHVVDVGWKGTIQSHLQAALPSRAVRGSYLGIVGSRRTPAVLRDGETKRGLLFDSRKPGSRHYRILRHFKSIYEFLLTAEHGSAARYERVVVDGVTSVRPVLDDQAAEVAVFRQLIEPIQADIRRGFEELCRLDLLSERPILATLDDVADIHQRMLFHPTSLEIEQVASMRHYENFGHMGMTDVGRQAPDSRAGRMGEWVKAARQPSSLLGSGWPPLNLWSVGLGGLVQPLGVYRKVRERRGRSAA